jgi:hypothetical protein
MSTLAYADEVLPVDEVEELATLGDVTVADREVKMAEMLVESPTRQSATVTSTAGASRSCIPDHDRHRFAGDRPRLFLHAAASDTHDSAFAALFPPGATLSCADVSPGPIEHLDAVRPSHVQPPTVHIGCTAYVCACDVDPVTKRGS